MKVCWVIQQCSHQDILLATVLRVNVTCPGLVLPLAVRLICIHTWKPGLQQGSSALSFLSLLPSCILARKSALVNPLALDKSRADHSPPCTCFLQAVYFFLKGCFETGRFCPSPHWAPARTTLGEGSLTPRGGTCPPRAPGFAMHVGNILRWPWFMQKY